MTTPIAHQIDAIRSELARGAIVRARSLASALLLANPGNADVLMVSASVERKAGKAIDARNFLLRAIEIDGGTAASFNLLGNVLGDLGHLIDAERAYQQSTYRDPHFADPWINHGNLLIGQDNDRAVGYLEHATRLTPNSALAWIGLGKALRNAKRFDAAITAFAAAKRLDPTRATIPIQIGLTQLASGKPASAISTYDQAERSGLARPELYDNRAAARIEAGDIEGARLEYDLLVRRTPGYAPGHLARARLYWEYGLPGDPFESYRMLSAAYPGEISVWHAWLSALASFRQYEELISVADRARRAIGDDPGVIYLDAVARSETGDVDRAGHAFNSLAKHHTHDIAFLCAHARHALRSGDAALADRLCAAAIEQRDDDQLAWAYRGLAWRLLDDPRDAWLIDYDTMVALVPATPPGEDVEPADFARQIAGELRTLHTSQIHPADQSLRGGTQTAGGLFDREDHWIKRIEDAARHAVSRFVQTLPRDAAHPFLSRKSKGFCFSGSWSVRLKQSGFHVAHIHPQGWISSAFYFHVPPVDEANIDAGSLALGLAPSELGINLPARRIISPQPGMLCLFPSMLWHATIPFSSDEDRLTTAFDVVPQRQG